MRLGRSTCGTSPPQTWRLRCGAPRPRWPRRRSPTKPVTRSCQAFIPTKRLINTSVAPVVKKGATTILTADYTVSAGGITIASTITTGSVVSGDAITISYTPQAGADVQSLINSAPDISIHVEGKNEVDGKDIIFRGYKAKLGVAQNVSLIGDDFGTLRVTFTLQKDGSIVAAGKSQYFEIEQAT